MNTSMVWPCLATDLPKKGIENHESVRTDIVRMKEKNASSVIVLCSIISLDDIGWIIVCVLVDAGAGMSSVWNSARLSSTACL